MTVESIPAPRPPLVGPVGGPIALRVVGRVRTRTASPHAIWIAGFLALGLWLTHRFMFSSNLPAGTDMLDLLARARENAHWSTLTSAWSPTGLGSERQTSLDNAVGLLALILGSPVRAVELLMLALLVVAGATTYLLSYRWYRSPLAAGIAGALYMTSQAMLGRLASGWLHYELMMALAPLLIYAVAAVVDEFSVRRALVVAVLASAITFARQDLVLWIAPALALYVVVAVVTAQRPIVPLAHVFAAFTICAPAVLALSAYLLLPVSAGIHAPWFSTGQVFEAIRFNLLDRSLSAYQSVLGLGRDLGYLPSSGQEWWRSHPWVPLPVYYGAQAAVVAAACAALRWYRDRRTLFLVAAFALSAFLAKGIRAPLGSPYWWAVQHIPVFGNLRGPNRWLVPGMIAVSILAGLTLDRLLQQARRRSAGMPLRARVRTHRLVGCLVAATVLPVAPTLASGLQAWSPTPPQVALMKSVPRSSDTFAVASAPYGQSMQFVDQPGYRGWEHDLGVESPLFTGRPAVSTNSWDRRGSDFVDYTAGLLAQRDPAFAEILGASGVGYILSFAYPAAAPDLVAQSGGDPMYQQRALASFVNLEPTVGNSAGTLYRIPAASPLVSFRPNVAIVLGGRAGLAALADLPGIRLQDWAAYVADDVLTGPGGSIAKLATLIRQANLVMVAGASPLDLAVVGSTPVVRIGGITSNGGDERRVGLLLTDESARRGSLADQSILPPALPSVHQKFHLNRPERLELWTRVLVTSDPGAVTYMVDDRPVARLVPLAPGSGGFRWIRLASENFSAGSHRIDVIGTASAAGTSFEVDETRLVRPGDRKRAAAIIESALTSASGRIAQSIDLSSSLGAARPGELRDYAGRPIGTREEFWRPQDPRGVRSKNVDGAKIPSLRLTLVGRRPFYTIAHHDFATPRSFAGQGTLALRFRGTGSGRHYDLLVDADRRHKRFLSFPVVDSGPGWQTAFIRIDPGETVWSHVVALRVATKLKTSRGLLSLATPSVPFPTRLVVTGPTISSAFGTPTVTGDARGSHLLVGPVGLGSRRSVRVVLPLALTTKVLRLVVPPRSMPRAIPAQPVRYERTTSGLRLSVSTTRPGVLVFNQAFDPKWRLKIDGKSSPPSTPPVSALTNGFALGPGTFTGAIELEGGRLAGIGTAVSVATLIALLGLIFFLRPRTATRGSEWPEMPEATPSSIGIRPALLLALMCVALAHFTIVGAAALILVAFGWWRQSWELMLGLTLALLATGVFFSSVDRPDLADTSALLLLLALALAVGRLLIVQRRAVD